jgi:hypothetical protein
MKKTYKRHTRQSLFATAAKCKTRSEFAKCYPSEYQTCRTRGILDAACAHMPLNRWTDNQLRAVASRYTVLSVFRKEQSGAYQAAANRGLREEITAHMARGAMEVAA